jgi:hypothetical protein
MATKVLDDAPAQISLATSERDIWGARLQEWFGPA